MHIDLNDNEKSERNLMHKHVLNIILIFRNKLNEKIEKKKLKLVR